MADLLSHPFRPLPNGRAATVTEGTDEHVGEQLVHLLLCRPGERPLSPTVGTADPAFAGLDAVELQQAAEDHGIAVDTLDVTVTELDDVTERVLVTFD